MIGTFIYTSLYDKRAKKTAKNQCNRWNGGKTFTDGFAVWQGTRSGVVEGDLSLGTQTSPFNENTASCSIGIKFWQLNNCQILNFQGA